MKNIKAMIQNLKIYNAKYFLNIYVIYLEDIQQLLKLFSM